MTMAASLAWHRALVELPGDIRLVSFTCDCRMSPGSRYLPGWMVIQLVRRRAITVRGAGELRVYAGGVMVCVQRVRAVLGSAVIAELRPIGAVVSDLVEAVRLIDDALVGFPPADREGDERGAR